MRAIILEKPGSFNDLHLVENREIPEPEKNEIRVKVKAAGLNPVDYKLINGWTNIGWKRPVVLGLDVAGEVDAVGEEVIKFKTGDEVFYHGNLSKENGGFAQYACTTAHTAEFLPQGLDMVEAAALPCAGFTAYQAIVKKLKPDAGKTILIHAGAGGVGGFAIQLAKLADLTVFSTCSESNLDYVKALGADYVINYRQENVFNAIMDKTCGRGVDYIVNTIDSQTATQDIEMLAFGGELVAVVEHPDFNRIKFYEKAISIHEVALGGAHLNGDYKSQLELASIAMEMGRLVSEGKIKANVSKVITLDEIPDYLKELEKRHVAGKIVAKIE